jgi:ABC-type transport system substrate-binding protein
LHAADAQLTTAKRAADYKQVQTIAAQNDPFIPLTVTPYVDAWSKKVHGMNQLPTGATLYQDIWMSK